MIKNLVNFMATREKILYAGYGANRDPDMIKAITGRLPEFIGEVSLDGVELCVQRIEQIPAVILPTARIPKSPRAIVETAWGEDSGFETYTIRRQKEAKVSASLFRLSRLERDLVGEWELIDFGWYRKMSVRAQYSDVGFVQAQTEGMGEGQEIDRVVDGENYPTYLNEQKRMLSLARKVRRDYLEELGLDF